MDVTSPIRFDESKIQGVSGSQFMTRIDPATLPQVFDIDWREGSDETARRVGRERGAHRRGFAEDEGIGWATPCGY